MPDFGRKLEGANRSKLERREMFAKNTFGASLSENLREFLRPLPHGGGKSEFFATPNLDFAGFWHNLRDLILSPKFPPLKTTSQPIPVNDLWSKNTQFTRVQSLSIAAHVLVLILLVIPIAPRGMALVLPGPSSSYTYMQISRYLPKLPPAKKQPTQGGGSSGERNPLPASNGRPAPFATIQLAPPRVRTVESARLLVPPSIIGDSRIPMPSKLPNWGDPHVQLVNESSGPGANNGIGSRSGNGIGDGIGDGLGDGEQYGTGGDIPCGGCEGISMPTCAYCPRADYSDEAVKAKYEGIVVLLAVITPDGRAIDIHVSKELGLGLDEKAVEAVRGWRFKPAIGPDRRPIAVRVPIEVVFHLY
jgi:protein TonB